jgi:hypothetical protein
MIDFDFHRWQERFSAAISRQSAAVLCFFSFEVKHGS